MSFSRRFVVCLSLSLWAGWAPAAARADIEEDLALQQERQKQIQADTDSMVRRLGTMLRVLEYYQVDKAGERKMLEEMTGILSGLSRNQMAEVISRLEAAAKSTDGAKSNEEVLEAYARHREILDSLKGLLSRHDAIRSLDQAADRFDKVAKDQLELHFQTTQLIKDSTDLSNPYLPPTRRLNLSKRSRNVVLEPKRLSDAQAEVHLDVDGVIRQVLELRATLPEEQQARVALMKKLAAEQRLLENLSVASKKLKAVGYAAQRHEAWREVGEIQWKSASQLKELARALRLSAELLAVLREARERVDQAILKQDELNKETKSNLDKDGPKDEPKNPAKPQVVFPDLTPLPGAPRRPDLRAELERVNQEAMAQEKIQELGKDQARIQYDAKDTANLVKPHAQDLATKIDKAEQAMKEARDALSKIQPKDATRPQEKASETLKDVRADLDKLIAAAEKQKDDPLTALKKAADDVEKLLKEQTETRDKTKETVGEKQNVKVPELATTQKDLANRTEQLKETPLPVKDETKASLDKANKAMTQAAKALDNQKSDKAVPKQDQAIKALEDAKKDIADKVAELEKRKDDMAKLEEAAKKLEELAKAENNIADKAKAMEAKSEPKAAKDLAKTQDKLTPEAKEVAKNIEAAAPEAAKKVNEGAKNMEAAKKELDQNKAKPAAGEAKEAAKKLEEAQKEIAKALDEMKAKDIADQAALQPNKVDPFAAALQIAKALEQTQKAAAQAKQSEQLAGLENNRQQDLAKLQAKIAREADKMHLAEAAQDAGQAADALKQGDINKAIDNQEPALAKLQDASQKPSPNLPPKALPPPGEVKGSAAKDGTPLAAESKANQAQPGENKNMAKGEPKAGLPKTAALKTGEAKTGLTKAGTKPTEAKVNKAQPAEAKAPAAKSGEAKAGEPKAGQAKQGVAKSGPPKLGQPQAKTGKPKVGTEKPGQLEDAQALAAEAKTGEAMQGEAKLAKAQAGQAKVGEGTQAQAKAGMGPEDQPREAQSKTAEGPPLAKDAAQLAQVQQDVLDATRALTQSQNNTQAAMSALGQAQAQAPQSIQKQLQQAGKQLAQANQGLQKGQPTQAGQNQAQAAKELGNALKALNDALAGMNQPPAQPGQPSTAQAKAGPPGQPGQDGKEGMGDEGMGEGDGEGKEGKAKTPGKGKQPGPGPEKNDTKGTGDRVADGKVSNSGSQLNNVSGDGSFLHLPPRQRELIRQALSGQLPPEYAAMIQQYYINLARGRAAPGAMPALPAPNR